MLSKDCFLKCNIMRDDAMQCNAVQYDAMWYNTIRYNTIQNVYRIAPEAYHPEASNFCLYVGNYAGVFYLTNQKHGIIFCPNMESVDWRKIMAFIFSARKLIRTKIRAISLAGNVLLAEDVFGRVYREAQGTFSFILGQPWRVKWTRLYRVF